MAGFSSGCVYETERAAYIANKSQLVWGSLRGESYIFTLVSMAGGPEYKTQRGKVKYEISSTSLSLPLRVAYAATHTLAYEQGVVGESTCWL